MEPVAKPTLPLGGREAERGDAGRRRLDDRRRVERLGSQPTGGLVRGGGAEVAAREGHDRVCGLGGRDEGVVQAAGALVGRCQAGFGSVASAEQRIGPRSPAEASPRHAPRTIATSIIRPPAEASEPTVTPVPMRPSRTEASAEFGLEDGAELVACRRSDSIERAQAFERGHQRFPRSVLRIAEAGDRAGSEPTPELVVAPLDPVGPRFRVGRSPEPAAQVGDEFEE